ncbi:MAG: glycosyl hydrolase family 30, partial [Bacteroidales bacterium]|nr:glycosyl hydrolase family 30 [Bacteroidales bacterium]
MGLKSCSPGTEPLKAEVYETSAAGNKLSLITEFATSVEYIDVRIDTSERFQEITGFGGAFTESSAHLLNRLGPENRARVLEAYFGESGARYSLTRTHIGSCDFSLGNYSYAPVADDRNLVNFSIKEDEDDLIPMILDAQKLSKDGFRIVASPWTAPPWMKDNKHWVGGKLLPEYYETYALLIHKYLVAYEESGIPIWGITVVNEPLGNGNNWESMHLTPEETNELVTRFLGPLLRSMAPEVKILGYDQNREEVMRGYVDAMYADELTASYYDGMAIHWYASTYEYFPEMLQYAHNKAPGKYLIQTEACVDAEVPRWNDDKWYWLAEATDWGYDWAPEDMKYLHPKYIPAHRYARDIIGCLNNWVDGWIDWNMVLDRQGGPNWASNWCVAPVIVDPDKDEVYFTPLYYVMAQFSRFIRPGAVRIGLSADDPDLMLTSAL